MIANFSWRRQLLWCAGLLLLGFCLTNWQGCARSCIKDSECSNNLRCGPGKFCLVRCFVGEDNACINGHICDVDNSRCVPGVANTPDAGSQELVPETSAEDSNPGEANPPTPEAPVTP